MEGCISVNSPEGLSLLLNVLGTSQQKNIVTIGNVCNFANDS